MANQGKPKNLYSLMSTFQPVHKNHTGARSPQLKQYNCYKPQGASDSSDSGAWTHIHDLYDCDLRFIEGCPCQGDERIVAASRQVPSIDLAILEPRETQYEATRYNVAKVGAADDEDRRYPLTESTMRLYNAGCPLQIDEPREFIRKAISRRRLAKRAPSSAALRQGSRQRRDAKDELSGVGSWATASPVCEAMTMEPVNKVDSSSIGYGDIGADNEDMEWTHL